MCSIIRRVGFAAVFLVTAAGVAISCSGDVSVELIAHPISAVRGEAISYTVTVANEGVDSLEDVTLYLPLPTGIDQWSAEYRVDAGPWQAYPPNGLLPLDPIPASTERILEVQARVELGAPASLSATAQLRDVAGPLASASVTVNVLPSVDAGPDLIVDLGGSTVLSDASAGDGGGGIAAYAWTDDGAGGVFDDPAILHPTYIPPEASCVLELKLTVVDHDGGEASDSLRLQINAVPTVLVGADLVAEEGDVLPLSARVNDQDGWIVSYAWNDGGAGGEFSPPAGVADPTYRVPHIAGCHDAEIELTLVVTDDGGAEATDSLTVLVRNPNEPPRVTAGSDREMRSGEEVVLRGSVADGGEIVSVRWSQISGPTVELAEADRLTAWFTAPDVTEEAETVLRLAAVDDCGDEAADDVRIRILPAAVPPGEEGPPEGATSSTSRLSVTLEAFDERGFALSPFDQPAWGESVTFRVTVTNTGDGRLSEVVAQADEIGGVALSSDWLEPWASAKGEFRQSYQVDSGAGGFAVGIDVSAVDERGRTVVGRDEFEFYGDASTGRLVLEKRGDREEVGVGESVEYTYAVSNFGVVPLYGLMLTDDRLGRIPLPVDSLMPGETFTVTSTYLVRGTEPAGPWVNVAVLSGFTPGGTRVTAEDEASVEIIGPGGGEGGAGGGEVGRLVLSEIAWAGTPEDPAGEWIEIANLGPDPVDLTGWRLCWYEKGDRVPEPSEWCTIELRGIIDPIAPSEERGTVTFVEVSDGLWRLVDQGGGEDGEGVSAQGYYLLERGHDGVVGNIMADLVYEPTPSEPYELPDDGATVILIDPSGRIVDSANTQSPPGGGWPGGDIRNGASMERIDLHQGDYDANWQTNTGILTYGRGIRGRRLFATAGRPNSPPIDELLGAAEAWVTPVPIEAGGTIALPEARPAEVPLIRVTTSASPLVAGGGGATFPSFSTRRVLGRLELAFDPRLLPAGVYYVWVTWQEGEAFLLPLRR